ncbi:hypothetical protein PPERSA_11168 [Pseudocohnilembus persalinus]|uniref:Ion transport domain-containing protein n=1 Tax=Pseudocohnilembus persalinus TaxID=266149 RepID=A0A0V0QZ80_PSEPJ|nr:hypothetical protein PPERSA_11168 [Pseudocohnilembus persalinus]|eukprot:KRX07619.1 hypothetical protein PPERSA_11168 [Pseudocohnilembus persalinus]
MFLTECALKIIASGFIINGEQSYLRNLWNVLDFLIVIFSVVGIFVIIINLIVVCLIFYLLFGIFGTNYFKGTFYYCNMKHIPFYLQDNILTKQDCFDYGGDWINNDYNFDSITNSMISLFVISTTEGWVDMMWNGADAVGIDYQPQQNYRKGWVLFYVFFIIVSSFFIMNLFAGIVVDSFNQEKDKIGGISLLSKEQRQWIDIQQRILQTEPVILIEVKENDHILKKYFFKIVINQYFEYFILLLIVLNTIVFMLMFNRQSEQQSDIIKILNYVFLGIFTLEAILKIVSFELEYFKDSWNQFDLCVVIMTFIGLALEYTQCSTGESWNLVMADIARQRNPSFACLTISNYEDFQKHGMQGCGSSAAYLFLIIFQLFFTMIVLSLFVAVILEGFDKNSKAEQSIIKPAHLQKFVEVWKKYDKNAIGLIQASNVKPLMESLPMPLGWKGKFLTNIKKRILIGQMEMPIYKLKTEKNPPMVYYYDMLFEISRSALYDTLDFEEQWIEPENEGQVQLDIFNNIRNKLNQYKNLKYTEYTTADYVAVVLVQQRVKNFLQEIRNRNNELENESQSSEKNENVNKQFKLTQESQKRKKNKNNNDINNNSQNNNNNDGIDEEEEESFITDSNTLTSSSSSSSSSSKNGSFKSYGSKNSQRKKKQLQKQQEREKGINQANMLKNKSEKNLPLHIENYQQQGKEQENYKVDQDKQEQESSYQKKKQDFKLLQSEKKTFSNSQKSKMVGQDSEIFRQFQGEKKFDVVHQNSKIQYKEVQTDRELHNPEYNNNQQLINFKEEQNIEISDEIKNGSKQILQDIVENDIENLVQNQDIKIDIQEEKQQNNQ